MFPNRACAAAVVPSAAAVLLLWSLTPSGLALTSDSVQYLAAGRSLSAGGSPVTVSGDPFVHWPPLLPFVVAALAKAGPVLDLLRIFNAAVYGATVALTAWYIHRNTGGILAAACGAALLAVHPWVGFVHAHLWSEPLFLLWTLLALMSTDSPWRFGAWSGLAILTRYAGLSLVPVGVAALLLDRSRPMSARLRRAAPAAGLGLTALGLLAIYNWAVSGTPLPPRPPTTETLSGAAGSLASTLVEATLPWRIATALSPAGWILSLSAAWLVALVAALRSSRRSAAAMVLWIGGYAALLILTASHAAIDPMGPRLLVPILMAASLALLLLAPPVPATLVLAGVLAVGIVHDGRLWTHIRNDGPDSLRAFARRSLPVPAATRLVSNFPEAAYLMTGRSVSLSPRRTTYGGIEDVREADLLWLSRMASAGPITLLWFRARTSTRLLPLPSLAARVELVPLGSGPDVEVFELRPSQPVVLGPSEDPNGGTWGGRKGER